MRITVTSAHSVLLKTADNGVAVCFEVVVENTGGYDVGSSPGPVFSTFVSGVDPGAATLSGGSGVKLDSLPLAPGQSTRGYIGVIFPGPCGGTEESPNTMLLVLRVSKSSTKEAVFLVSQSPSAPTGSSCPTAYPEYPEREPTKAPAVP